MAPFVFETTLKNNCTGRIRDGKEEGTVISLFFFGGCNFRKVKYLCLCRAVKENVGVCANRPTVYGTGKRLGKTRNLGDKNN